MAGPDLVAVNDNDTWVMLSTGSGFPSAPAQWVRRALLRQTMSLSSATSPAMAGPTWLAVNVSGFVMLVGGYDTLPET